MNVPAERLSAQLRAVVRAWGMAEAAAEASARLAVAADLRGIDSHGVMMLVLYGDPEGAEVLI
jgi:LDH2 family malate/lactate/ureidoglycolate dehydrogenase